ncbi:MAG: hypothetical protein HUU55_23655 [Myxococcales bacterium]|nr:hypothetical protein [Myxococcales bacterium]
MNVTSNLAAHIRFLNDAAVQAQVNRKLKYISAVLGSVPHTRSVPGNQPTTCFYVDVSGIETATRYFANMSDPVAVASVLELGALARATSRQVGWGMISPADVEPTTEPLPPSSSTDTATTVELTMNGCGESFVTSTLILAAEVMPVSPGTRDTVSQFAAVKGVPVVNAAPDGVPFCLRTASVRVILNTRPTGERRCNLAMERPPLVDWFELFAQLGQIPVQNHHE